MKAAGPLLLIDAMNVFIRNYCKSGMMDADGRRVGGVIGSLVSIRKMIRDFKASNALVIWDGEGGSQRRKAIFSEYKAGRSIRLNRQDDDMAEDPAEQLENLREQISLTKELLNMLGIPQVRCDGVEADDIMAFLAVNIEQTEGVVIATTDQDLLQLIRERSLDDSGEVSSGYVKVWSPVKKVLFDRTTFIREYNVLPENFRFVKALTGDNSDNIDGIKGFGQKTITKLFPELNASVVGMDEFLSFIPRIKGVLGQRLSAELDRFKQNMTLVDLSSPFISMHSARESRMALSTHSQCREVDFRVKAIKERLSFGENFIDPIRQFVWTRRKFIGSEDRQTSVEGTERTDA